MSARKARVGIDARMDKPWRTGLGRYARGLVEALTQHEMPDIRWVVLKHPLQANVRFSAPGSSAEEHVVAGDLDTPRNLVMGRAIDALRLDLYHALENFVPLGLRVPRVIITLHDLVYVEHPELVVNTRFGRIQAAATRAFGIATMRHAIARSTRVIAVSEATRAAALRRFRELDPERIVTVHNGIEHAAFPRRSGAEADIRFFLVLGNSRPYKNVAGALEAFALLYDRSLELVVAGRGDCFAALERQAARLGIADRVRFRTKPSDSEVLALLHGARALVFPSHIEGFGLPLLEAMSSGCPVIASDIPVLREVCGDAASYVAPTRPEDIAHAMRKLDDSAELRELWRSRGYARAAEFSWKRCAEQTLAVYRDALRERLELRVPRRI